ncbi:conjugal transfer nickase/helicase domain-containing protein [Candidatus Methylocalor cossyra]|uniref:Putative conjugal transfer nickase/helicase TraI C-terminal domain-containing protein n=1 Tax=Candidatus Methylocalor cossyra TaxID=3108543 RepID=A0ABM9NMQ3_9GAMM
MADGIAARRLDYNNSGARVHVVPKGVLLVSPGLFPDCVAHANSALSGGETLSWEKVQKRFLKLGIHRRTPTRLNVHRYTVIGDNRQTVINGVLLCDLTMALKKSELYSSLWSSCDELRGGMDASQGIYFLSLLLN